MLASSQAVIKELSGLPIISEPDISARDILAQIFHHKDILAHACFSPAHVLAHAHFWHKEFSAPRTFWHRIFWHLYISAHRYFGTFESNMDISAHTFWHLCYCAKMSKSQNVHVLKCLSAEMSVVPKNPCAEKSPCRKDLVLKHVPEHLLGRNVHVPKCPGDEM